MLVLSRKTEQQICIGDSIRITVLRIQGRTVRLGIEAPRGIRIVRAELQPLPDSSGSEPVEPANADHSKAEATTGPARRGEEGTEEERHDLGPLAWHVRRRCRTLWAVAQ